MSAYTLQQVEDRAERLYAAIDRVGVPWSRRPPIIREPFLRLAERQLLEEAKSPK